jgi:hypothetical protein
MSKAKIPTKYLSQIAELDESIAILNTRKIKLIFKALDIKCSNKDFTRIMEWELVLVTVPDRQMAVQLNKLSAYIPNLKFVVDGDSDLYTLQQGVKGRRVWKGR